MQSKKTAQNPEKILWIESSNSDYTTIESLPDEFLHLVLPYARAYFHRDNEGDIFSQNIKLPDFSIWSHDIIARAAMVLAPQTPHQILALHFMELDGLVADIYNNGEFQLREKEVNLFNLTAHFHKAPLNAGDEICSFHINILPDALPGLATRYPELQHLAAMEVGPVSGSLNKTPYTISLACQQLVRSILTCKLVEDQAKFYLHRCCVDLYTNFACQDKLSGQADIKLTPGKKEIIKEIFNYLMENVQEEFNILRLAYLYDIRVTELKAGFEQMFFISPATFAYQQKIMAAYNMMVTTDERLNIIAAETGFGTWQALKKAFEAYYGCTIACIRNAQ